MYKLALSLAGVISDAVLDEVVLRDEVIEVASEITGHNKCAAESIVSEAVGGNIE